MTNERCAIAICGRRHSEVHRSHDYLDQTRTVQELLYVQRIQQLKEFVNAFVSQDWRRAFTGNCTRMKVVGLERMAAIDKEVKMTLQE